jgi:hypothetical protein
MDSWGSVIAFVSFGGVVLLIAAMSAFVPRRQELERRELKKGSYASYGLAGFAACLVVMCSRAELDTEVRALGYTVSVFVAFFCAHNAFASLRVRAWDAAVRFGLSTAAVIAVLAAALFRH